MKLALASRALLRGRWRVRCDRHNDDSRSPRFKRPNGLHIRGLLNIVCLGERILLGVQPGIFRPPRLFQGQVVHRP